MELIPCVSGLLHSLFTSTDRFREFSGIRKESNIEMTYVITISNLGTYARILGSLLMELGLENWSLHLAHKSPW